MKSPHAEFLATTLLLVCGAPSALAQSADQPSTRVALVARIASLDKPARFTVVREDSLERFLRGLSDGERPRYDPRALAIVKPPRGAPISITHQQAASPIDTATPWADRVLQGIQSRAKQSKHGTVDGWAIPPRYRTGRIAFTAATQEVLPDGSRRCSCLGYKLGRAGYLYFYALATPETAAAVVRNLDAIVDGSSFLPGERHGDPNPAP